jgi:parallel beta-helix repeat protein
MNNLNESKLNYSKTFSSVTMISIMITLLTFSAVMNTSLVLATEREGEEYDELGIGNIKNNNELSSTLSLSSLTSRQGMDIGNLVTDSSNVPSSESSSSPSSLQKQDLPSPTDQATTNAACGQVSSGVVNLTSNLNCTGDGIIVGGPNTVINMNGFSITGPGADSSKVGIMASNVDNVIINGPGSIGNFQAGILLSGTNGFKIDSTTLENNQIAIFMTGADNAEVQQNMIQNNHIGIASHSAIDSKIESNLVNENLLSGVTFVNTKSSTIDMNNVHGSQDGVFVDEQSADNTISSNNVLDNEIDINNANGLPININSNQYAENNCGVSNPSGLCIGR